MLQYDPTHRPTMTEVMAHPWIQMPNLSRSQVKQTFKQRREMINDSKEAEK